MDLMLLFVIIGVVLSAIGGIIWWVIVFFFIGSAVRSVQRDLDRVLPNIELMLSQAADTPSGQLNSQQKAQIVNMMMRAQNQMGQLDGIYRQRYETRVGDLMGMASAAGIDWTPGSY
jgi:hypothetical protein